MKVMTNEMGNDSYKGITLNNRNHERMKHFEGGHLPRQQLSRKEVNKRDGLEEIIPFLKLKLIRKCIFSINLNVIKLTRINFRRFEFPDETFNDRFTFYTE